jgi:ubiquitin C-terminal hydrolase
MVVYYGRHYTAYFYSEKHDGWFYYDDEKIKKIGNWADVIKNCVKGRQ